jgi:branched-chain amino acid transport system permease protein
LPLELLVEAVLAGVLLGGFYAAVSVGLSVAFGLIDVPHIAHPAFLVLGAFGAYLLGSYGIDPLLAGVLLTPVFFLVAWRCIASTTPYSSAAAATPGCAAWRFSSASRLSSKWP